jgi:hypothetical protein
MKKSISILLAIAILLTMTACSSGNAQPTAEASSQEAAESSFMASGEGEDATQAMEPEQAIEPEKEVESQPVDEKEIPVIAEGDLGNNFEFGYNEEGFTLIYPNSGNEYQMAWYNDDKEIETAFHDVYGCHYIFNNGEERKTKAFYYTTDNGSLGNSIHYVNLETQEDRYIAQGILYETLEYGYFNGKLVVWINSVNVKNGLEQGYYIYERDGTMLTYIGVDYDQNFIKTGEREKEEPPAPEAQPEAQTPAEPEPKPEPKAEPEEEKPISVTEADALVVNTLYEADLSGDGEVELFFLTSDEAEGVFFFLNEEILQLSNIDPYLMSNEYRIVDLDPAEKGKDLEILEAAPPYDQNMHFIQVKSVGNREDVRVVGPLSVAYDAYENDRVLYQGNDQIMVIEMSNIITAFYQKFYQVEHGTITDMSRPDITKYMTPFRTTMSKGILAFPTDHYTDSGNIYLNPGDEIIIHGESEGNLWIEVLGECSSEFMWLLGTMIDHYPDANGQYLFPGVQFWS